MSGLTHQAIVDRQFMIAFGKALEEAREDKKLIRAQLHRMSGVTPAEQRSYEQGAMMPTLEHVRWLADALDLTAGRLLNLAEEKL